MSHQSLYICQNCGASYPKWQGQCSQCQQWNSLVEELSIRSKASSSKKISQQKLTNFIVNFPDVKLTSGSKSRFSTQMQEMDRVLGGGLVPGSVILLGGEPGIGKSTLLTQLILKILSANQTTVHQKSTQMINQNRSLETNKILYVCGEESPSQISLRINRILNNDQFLSKTKLFVKNQKTSSKRIYQSNSNTDFLTSLQFITTTDADEIKLIIEKSQASLVIIDSIQTLKTEDLTGASGSIGQIRECTERIIKVVKEADIPAFLIGHVTKDGVIAGPKVLEHMVDTVLELSGERSGQFRLLRALKNRFGATDEVGVFRVVDYGLEEVSNPNELFLENQNQLVPGSAIVSVLEGTRPLLLEVQALVLSSPLAMPRRVGRGVDVSRIQVLAAVLEKHVHLPLANHDIFVNAAGGFKINEPAIDLGLSVAIASSLKNKKITQKIVFIGEVGLLGEIRRVNYLAKRIKEAKRLGFSQVISRETHLDLKAVLKSLALV